MLKCMYYILTYLTEHYNHTFYLYNLSISCLFNIHCSMLYKNMKNIEGAKYTIIFGNL